MNFIAKIFWNYDEHRFRSLWRLLAQTLIVILSLLVVRGITLAVIALGLLSTQAITLDQMSFQSLSKILYDFSDKYFDLPLEISVFLTAMFAIWLAGRFLDRRGFLEFGLRLNKRWWTNFGFGLFLGALLITLIFFAELAAGWVTVSGTFVSRLPNTPFFIAILFPIASYTLVGFQEELNSHGYQLTNIAEGFNGKRISPAWAIIIATLLSSLFFGLLHLGNPNMNMISTVNLVLFGVLFALGYILTGELSIPIGLHITWNFFQGCVFGFPVSGLMGGAATFMAVEQGGPALWTGGAFGPEAGLLSVVGVLLGCLLTVLWVRWRYGQVALCTAIADVPEQIRRGTEPGILEAALD